MKTADPFVALNKRCIANVFATKQGERFARLGVHVDEENDADIVLVWNDFPGSYENLSSIPLTRETAAHIIAALNKVYPGVSQDYVDPNVTDAAARLEVE